MMEGCLANLILMLVCLLLPLPYMKPKFKFITVVKHFIIQQLYECHKM
jgi:hypothetical protein